MCGLLALPAELRSEILILVLVRVQQTPIIPLAGHLMPSTALAPQAPRFCANILRTCHQLRSEGEPILYGMNCFAAHDSLLADHPRFLLQTQPHRITLPPVTSPRVIKLIKRFYIHVRLDTDARFTAAQVRESFSGVEELQIEVFQSMYDSCDYGTLMLFEGVRGVGKARVYGSVGNGQYARYLEDVMMRAEGESVAAPDEHTLGRSLGWDYRVTNKTRQWHIDG
jgi:hypothetical protein